MSITVSHSYGENKLSECRDLEISCYWECSWFFLTLHTAGNSANAFKDAVPPAAIKIENTLPVVF